MSAFIVSKLHVACIVRFAGFQLRDCMPFGYREVADDWGAVAALLYAENVRSVNHRYPNHPPEEPVSFDPGEVTRAPLLSPVQCIKACDCLEYQSCEHPEWQDSVARKVLRNIRAEAIRRLPGYDEAPWGIDSASDLRREGVAR